VSTISLPRPVRRRPAMPASTQPDGLIAMAFPSRSTKRFSRRWGRGRLTYQILTRGGLVAQKFDVFALYNAAVLAAIWGKPQDIVTEGNRADISEKGSGLMRRVSGCAPNHPICTQSSSGAMMSQREEVEASFN